MAAFVGFDPIRSHSAQMRKIGSFVAVVIVVVAALVKYGA